jgi:hypothetical protein
MTMTVPIAKVIAAASDATPHVPPTDKAMLAFQLGGLAESFRTSDCAPFVCLGLCLSSDGKKCSSSSYPLAHAFAQDSTAYTYRISLRQLFIL